MGREEEIAYAREHGIPVKGANRGRRPYSIDDNLWGRSSEGRDDRGPRPSRPPTTSSSSSPGPRRRPTSRSWSGSASSAGRPVSIDGERLGLVELLERAAELGAPPRGRDRRPHRGPDRRAQGPRHLRGPGRGDRPRRAPRAREARLDDPPEQLQARARGPVGLPLLRRALARAAAPRPRRLHGVGERVRHRRGDAEALQGLGAAVVARSSPYALYDRSLASFGESGGEFSQDASPGFIELFTMQSRMAHRVRNREDG